MSILPSAPPVVSVMLKSYNMAGTLRRAVESALGQVTAFPYEILLADDCSTDGSRELAIELARSHPARVVLLPRTRRLGMVGNTLDCIRRARGRYVAWLDGDDYWTDPGKLQKQADFLDAHPGFSGCCGPVLVRKEGEQPFLAGPDGTEVDLATLIRKCWIYTPSILFRKPCLPAFFDLFHLDDWPVYVWIAREGPIGVMPEVMAAYSLSASSAFQEYFRLSHPGQTARRRAAFEMWRKLAPYLPSALAARAVVDHGGRLLRTALREHSWAEFLRCALALLCALPATSLRSLALAACHRQP